MPDGGIDGIDVNYVSQAWEYYFGQTTLGFENYNSNLFHGIPTIDADWLRLDLWSTTSGNNDGYDFNLSDPSVYEVLRHGFRVHQKGFHKVSCTMTLDDTSNGHHNVAFQVRKKLAASSVFTRVGVPVTTGYIKRHSSLSWSGASINLSAVVQCNPGDEIAIFSTRIGLTTQSVLAPKKHCSLRIESLN